MALLKDLYCSTFYNQLTDSLEKVLPKFDKGKFMHRIHTPEFENMELKQRMRHTTNVFHEFLPTDYPEAAASIIKLISQFRNDGVSGDLVHIFLPDYIECHGLDHFQASVETMEQVTQFVSCEFAVRPFLLKYGDQMMARMQQWSLHPNYKVRRLATEGCRPRLPWAIAVPQLKKDPSAILPILENLKNDPSDFVRKSVANNLNDISKDHPDTVLEIAGRWKGLSKETDAIIKHGCRTLLKQGHAKILDHYTLNSKQIRFNDFSILTPHVEDGGDLVFTFEIKNTAKTAQTVRLEYALYFKRLNGQYSKKVFKISERSYQPEESANVKRKQSFRPITTRKYYPGEHHLSVIINGTEKELVSFQLL